MYLNARFNYLNLSLINDKEGQNESIKINIFNIEVDHAHHDEGKATAKSL